MPENNSEYLNSRQMAARMGVSTRSLERYRADGLIPFIPLTKRAYLYNPQKVFAILESIEIPSRHLKAKRSSAP